MAEQPPSITRVLTPPEALPPAAPPNRHARYPGQVGRKTATISLSFGTIKPPEVINALHAAVPSEYDILKSVCERLVAVKNQNVVISSIDGSISYKQGDEFPITTLCTLAFPVLPNNPNRGRSMMFFVLESQGNFDLVKRTETVTGMAINPFLRENGIFLNETKFVMTPTATAGYLTMINANHTSKSREETSLTSSIQEYLNDRTDEEEVCFYAQLTIPNRAPLIEVVDTIKVTEFSSDGTATRTIKSKVLTIRCEAADVGKISNILMATTLNPSIGQFIPSRTRKAEQQQIFTNFVLHAKFLQDSVAIPVIGIHRHVMKDTLARYENKPLAEGLLQEKLDDGRFIFDGLEQTEDTDSQGRWLLLTGKDRLYEGRRFIDEALPRYAELTASYERIQMQLAHMPAFRGAPRRANKQFDTTKASFVQTDLNNAVTLETVDIMAPAVIRKQPSHRNTTSGRGAPGSRAGRTIRGGAGRGNAPFPSSISGGSTTSNNSAHTQIRQQFNQWDSKPAFLQHGHTDCTPMDTARDAEDDASNSSEITTLTKNTIERSSRREQDEESGWSDFTIKTIRSEISRIVETTRAADRTAHEKSLQVLEQKYTAALSQQAQESAAALAQQAQASAAALEQQRKEMDRRLEQAMTKACTVSREANRQDIKMFMEGQATIQSWIQKQMDKDTELIAPPTTPQQQTPAGENLGTSLILFDADQAAPLRPTPLLDSALTLAVVPLHSTTSLAIAAGHSRQRRYTDRSRSKSRTKHTNSRDDRSRSREHSDNTTNTPPRRTTEEIDTPTAWQSPDRRRTAKATTTPKSKHTSQSVNRFSPLAELPSKRKLSPSKILQPPRSGVSEGADSMGK